MAHILTLEISSVKQPIIRQKMLKNGIRQFDQGISPKPWNADIQSARAHRLLMMIELAGFLLPFH